MQEKKHRGKGKNSKKKRLSDFVIFFKQNKKKSKENPPFRVFFSS